MNEVDTLKNEVAELKQQLEHMTLLTEVNSLVLAGITRKFYCHLSDDTKEVQYGTTDELNPYVIATNKADKQFDKALDMLLCMLQDNKIRERIL